MTSKTESKTDSEPSDIHVDTEETSAVVRTLTVDVAAPRVKKAFDRAYRELSRSAQVRGFRRGKVPRSVLEKLYSASIAEELERQLIGETLSDAVELADLAPVSEPDIQSDTPSPVDGFRYTVRIEVKPDIQLPELQGLPATRPAVSVEESEIDERLEQMRVQNAPQVEEPEDTEAAEGDFLTLDFAGRVDGEPFEGGAGRDVVLELGSGQMIPGFEDQLVGVKAGEDRELSVQFPDDYRVDALRGKDAEFSCHVAAIKRRQLPELDDEFAKDVGDFDSLADLRTRIREEITEQRDQAARGELHRTLLDSLIERTEFEVPPGMVERQIQQQAQSLHRQFQGQLPDEFIHAQIERMREEGREPAERRVRETLLLDAVSRAEALEASDDEVDARLDEMAAQQGMEADALRRMAREQNFFDAVRGELIEKKALDFLVAGAKVEENSDT